MKSIPTDCTAGQTRRLEEDMLDKVMDREGFKEQMELMELSNSQQEKEHWSRLGRSQRRWMT